MYRSFIRRNITAVAVIIFVILFCLVQIYAPHFLYNKDGSLRQFGIGYKKKTVIPNWFVALLLAILSYLFVLYYLAIPKFKF
jgi:quinol-cytochrome oxidoreductase complex cytochrome b subunit